MTEERDRLAERLEVIEAQKAHDETRGQETFPDALVGRLLEGGNPVRVFRQHRGMTLKDLAAATGLSVGYLSDLENSKWKGPVETMKSIAAALAVDLDMIS